MPPPVQTTTTTVRVHTSALNCAILQRLTQQPLTPRTFATHSNYTLSNPPAPTNPPSKPMANDLPTPNGHGPSTATNGSTPTFAVKAGLAQMLKGGVIMDVVNAEQVRPVPSHPLFSPPTSHNPLFPFHPSKLTPTSPPRPASPKKPAPAPSWRSSASPRTSAPTAA